MTRKYFGTDGIRGLVGEPPITPDFMVRLGYAAGEVLVRRAQLSPGMRPAVLIGKDTRISGYMLEASLEAGFAAALIAAQNGARILRVHDVAATRDALAVLAAAEEKR